MKCPAVSGVVVSVLVGCAASPAAPDNYWRNAASDRADFATDNVGCSAAASRVKPTARADQLPGGATIMDNRIDRPPKRWVNAVADHAYMDCMAERGWQLVRK